MAQKSSDHPVSGEIGLDDFPIDAWRVFPLVLLRDAPDALNGIGATPQHQLLKRTYLLQVALRHSPKDSLPQVLDNAICLRQANRTPVALFRWSVCATCVVHLTCPSVQSLLPRLAGETPAPRQRPFGLAIGTYPAGYDFPVPFGCRPSLPGASLSRWGIPPRLRLAYRLPGPHRGYWVPHS